MTRNNNTRSLVILGLMTAILIVFSFTPIGTIPIGPLSITLNIIPIAIAAAALGPAGGAAMGAVVTKNNSEKSVNKVEISEQMCYNRV